MNRRDFLQFFSLAAPGFASSELKLDTWRTFQVTTRVEVLKSSGVTRIWLPAPLIKRTPFQKTLSTRFSGEGGEVRLFKSNADDLGIVRAEFASGVRLVLSLTSSVATRPYFVNPGRAKEASIDSSQQSYYLRPSKLLPTDGIVKNTALKITSNCSSDFQRAQAIYEWIVDNTFRNPKTRGCGRGDIKFMLESGDLSGKCADLNSLYVGLARAAGLPARDVFGIRLGKSALGYKSLGTSSENVTKAQHCRAEVYIAGCGWIPVDPADVRKVILEEPPGHLALTDPLVAKARERLFGSWEMNWMAYNFAHDVNLPGSDGPPIGFLMYPQAETDEGRLDSLDPSSFSYEITSHETTPGGVAA